MTLQVNVRRCIFLVALMAAWVAGATDIRGLVTSPFYNGYGYSNVPRAGIPVSLAVVTPQGLTPMAQSSTNNFGFYFFTGVSPGTYYLLVGMLQFQIAIGAVPLQDIPPIVIN